MEEDVLRLDVAVDDVAVVHELDGVADLLDDAAHLLLGEPSLAAQAAVDVASAAQLQHQVQVVLVAEVGVELHDVGVVEVALDLYFPDELVDVLLRLEDLLGDLLQRAEEVGVLVPE